ncbi:MULTISPECIES: hypothetical protein [unclassified Lentimonas]|uniref:hypothetical protein n=1 Tax=unclassified Lentimonas TaxID=2630993 RepID=UPI0013252F9E|nr:MULTISPECIES: hypothetical protein [unclassified Lentimonas]CAA6690436.1 Unannotated [Lentimonas sp. CC19]CAA6693850.1 Unannotated [Lentimonas sp. CC10]CAA7068640.1 Unannotated [Lentimonas sp. CC11]
MKLFFSILLFFTSLLPLLSATEVPDEAQLCFQWFASLDYPDVKDAQFAEIWTGRGSNSERRAIYGFIISESETELTVLRTDLTQGTLAKANTRVAFEPRSFSEIATETLEALRSPPENTLDWPDDTLAKKAQVFFWAYACWRRGEIDLATQLYVEADKQRLGYYLKRETDTLQEVLEIQLGKAAMWNAMLRSDGNSLAQIYWSDSRRTPLPSRAELLTGFQRVTTQFPRCKYAEQAQASAAILECMIEEDANHPTLTQEQLDQLPLDQRVAELIWQLRDQNGHQMTQPGSCDIFNTRTTGSTGLRPSYYPQPTGTSPAHQLLAIGYPAVPALIEALTDRRFSRSVGYARLSFFNHSILNVGDCAQQILNRIAGHSIEHPSYVHGDLPTEAQLLARQQVYQAWWNEFQKKGKKQMLIEAIAAGAGIPGPLIRQLKEEAPEEVAGTLLMGIEQTQEDPWGLRLYIDELFALNTPEAFAMLRALIKDDPRRRVRIEAATKLLEEENKAANEAALDALIYEWQQLPESTPRQFENDFSALATALIASGDARAMQQLVNGWEQRPAHERFQIVRATGIFADKFMFTSAVFYMKRRPPTLEARAIMIDLLAHALEDTTADVFHGSLSDFQCPNPRIGDFALYVLNGIDNQKYAMSTFANAEQRDIERIAAANIWRAENNESLLQLPVISVKN